MGRVLLWAELLRALIVLIRQLEEAIPESGQGGAKMAALRAALDGCWDVFQALGPLAEMWPRIERAGSAIVTAFNQSGLFARAQK